MDRGGGRDGQGRKRDGQGRSDHEGWIGDEERSGWGTSQRERDI